MWHRSCSIVLTSQRPLPGTCWSCRRYRRRNVFSRRQNSTRTAILESMSNGMIALDLGQRVLSANRAVGAILGLDSEGARGRLLQELVRERLG